MKGIVFSEFLEFVEQQFGADFVDDMIELADPASRGAYTSVGTYDHKEIIQLVVALSELTKIPGSDLVVIFGKHLFGRLAATYPQLLEGAETLFPFLQSIENHIHVEVRKLYPDAELPQFTCDFPGPRQMSMTYHSKRPFADLAQGLIEGSLDHFNEDITIEREELPVVDGFSTRFLLTRQ
ncbi:MAG: heme NO-binding domain-containing protein [gamma proteobacterium endosymbiont of Lamellibrachia anaximandri]|nr:heme NO-binding domain-containing protein [gamma proteobacterium endosymbiont of Lamellibrachia anaximandri]MBL3533949.1 heme NO-binding domain-containing protein [gamma proteobacterium endosymbiont of Lamellibrachia anaximandri]